MNNRNYLERYQSECYVVVGVYLYVQVIDFHHNKMHN